MKRVAIQKGLTNVENYLRDQGYAVEPYDTETADPVAYYNTYDAIVLTGMRTNLMGTQVTSTKIPTIDANGLTPEEVKAAIDRKTR